MAVYELFSKRQKRLRGELPDVYQYEHIPRPLRVQIVHIIRDAMGDPREQSTFNSFQLIHNTLCREYGKFALSEEAAFRGIDYNVDTAVKAGGVGLLTNFIPPLALTLFAVDLAAVTALQAEMVYRIAATYGFSLKDPTRRGEALAIYGLSLGGSGVLKSGLSFVELLPIIGGAVGASSNVALIYGLGYVACRFYENKRNL